MLPLFPQYTEADGIEIGAVNYPGVPETRLKLESQFFRQLHHPGVPRPGPQVKANYPRPRFKKIADPKPQGFFPEAPAPDFFIVKRDPRAKPLGLDGFPIRAHDTDQKVRSLVRYHEPRSGFGEIALSDLFCQFIKAGLELFRGFLIVRPVELLPTLPGGLLKRSKVKV